MSTSNWIFNNTLITRMFKSVYKRSSNVDSQNRNKRAVKDERNI